MNEMELKWTYAISKSNNMLSFGICLSSSKYEGYEREIYLYINFYKYSFSIGRFYKIAS